MKQKMRLTEQDLHTIIESAVKKIIKERIFSPEEYEDKAFMNDYWDEREKAMTDDWEHKNIAIRKKYPGKSREWYEAMLDTFYENKNGSAVLKEYYRGPSDQKALIYNDIIEDYKAQEIADDYGVSEEDAVAKWFSYVVEDDNFTEENMPTHRQFVKTINSIDCDMYHDYGAGYYFLVKNENKQDMPGFEGTWDSLDSLTNPFNEAIKRAVASTINEMIEEEVGAGGGGATNAAGVMQGGGTNPEAGQYTVPFGTVQRKKGYSPKGDANGDVTKQSSNVDMSPALKRKDGKGGSISIPKNRK